MKLLLDEQLSPRLVEALDELYPGSAHVHGLGLGRTADSNIWEHAKANRFAIVTKDADFFERSHWDNDSPKIVWLRIGNCPTDTVKTVLTEHYDAIRRFIEESQETCLILGGL